MSGQPMFAITYSVLGVIALATSGCASIIDGSTQVVSFNSNPDAARVVVNGAEIGTTPLSTQIKRKNDTVVLFRKDGYADQTITLQTKLNPWFWGNILIGGLVGSTTDGISGAVREYAPNSYYVTLNPKNPPRPLASGLPSDRVASVRDFVLVNFDSVKHEADSATSGEYTRALNRLLFEANKPVRAAAELRAIFATCDGPVMCAEKLANDSIGNNER